MHCIGMVAKSDCESAYSLSCGAVRGGLACFARFPAGRTSFASIPRAPPGENKLPDVDPTRARPRSESCNAQRLSLSAQFFYKVGHVCDPNVRPQVALRHIRLWTFGGSLHFSARIMHYVTLVREVPARQGRPLRPPTDPSQVETQRSCRSPACRSAIAQSPSGAA